jgi:hypothetical protein
MLSRFLEANPGCKVGRPKLAAAASICLGAALALVTGIVVALQGIQSASPSPGLIVVGALLTLAGVLAARGTAGKLNEALELMRRGHACYAVGADDLLLVDSVGNTVVIALDEIRALEVVGRDARLKVDSELQGVIYAVLFDLFDDDGHGPSLEGFLDAVGPVLSARGVEVEHREVAGALIT